LLKAGEMLGMRFAVMHNLYFYNNLMAEIRKAIEEGRFEAFRNEFSVKLGKRI
jgi:queuine tRNA-ribosyltransferase